jgi:hypothetical protein
MRRLAVAVAVLAISAAPARAQVCAAGNTQDACEKAVDMWAYMMPQLGTSLVGGSHTLGIGSTLGGFPHFAVALRANAVMGNLPDLSTMTFNVGAAQNSNIDTPNQILGLPGVDFAVGVYKGFPLGVTRIGGVDLLGSITYLPEIEGDGASIIPTDGSMKIGLGARIGLLEQSLVVPGVSFSYLVRDLPTVDLTASSVNADIAINEFSVKTTSWRLSAQKNLLLFQLSAGYGQDTYKAGADVTGTIAAQNFNQAVSQDLKRTTLYGSVGINLLLAKIIAEVGQVNGGDVNTFNTFAEAADKSRLYGSIGARISF